MRFVDPSGFNEEVNDGNSCKYALCVNRCMERTEAAKVGTAALSLCPFASVKFPGNKKLLGSDNAYTSLYSYLTRKLGAGNALARLGRRLNPIANGAMAVGVGYTSGAFLGCMSVCASNCNYY